MVTISLCMIVKNEEAVLGRCLDCVKDVVDEIIIVDTMPLRTIFSGWMRMIFWSPNRQ